MMIPKIQVAAINLSVAIEITILPYIERLILVQIPTGEIVDISLAIQIGVAHNQRSVETIFITSPREPLLDISVINQAIVV